MKKTTIAAFVIKGTLPETTTALGLFGELETSLDKVIARAVSHGMIVTSISNAYPLTKKRIEQVNEAGLTLLQVSVDNIEPNDVSQKSWSKIKKRLLVLKEHAKFKVNITRCSLKKNMGIARNTKSFGKNLALANLLLVNSIALAKADQKFGFRLRIIQFLM